MARTVEARVKIDGEKQYTDAIASINKGNKVLSSEMKVLQAEFEKSGDRMAFLTGKADLLDRQLLEQKDKVETVRQAYENSQKTLSKYIQENKASGEEYEKLKRHAQDWEIQLNNARAAQYKLESAIRKNNEALQGENTIMQFLGGTVEELASKLGIKVPAGAKKALESMKGLSNGAVAALSAAAAGVAGLIKGVQALHTMTLQQAAEADELLTESMISGLSTKTIQQLKYAENLIDVSYSTISGSLTKLIKSMDAARDGNKKLAEDFKKLGVSTTDAQGNLRNAEDVFYELIDALGQVENATERDALSMELFGRSAQELNPLIIQGSDALAQYMDQAIQTGYVLDESQIAKLGEVDNAYQRMQLQLKTTKQELAADFAPVSIAAMEAFTSVVKFAGDAVNMLTEAGKRLKNSQFAAELRAVANAYKDLLGIERQYKTLADGTYEGGWYKGSDGLYHANGAGANIAGVTFDSTVGAYISKGGSRIYGDTAQYYNAETGLLNDAWIEPSTGKVRNRYVWDPETDKYWDRQTDSWLGDYTMTELEQLYGHNAAGMANWRGGLTWVGENGPELVSLPRGSQILNAQESRNAGGDTFVFNIDARNVRELNQLVAMAESARTERRMRQCPV